MSTLEIGKQYVALCSAGKNHEALETLFSADAVSVEAGGPPGMNLVSTGLDAIRAKGAWWQSNHDVHSAETTGPFPNGDRFAVRFVYDVTNKPSGRRIKMDEIALFTVANGKIVREEFFYTMG